MNEFKVPGLNVRPLNTNKTVNQSESHQDQDQIEIEEKTPSEDVKGVQQAQNAACPYVEPKWSCCPDPTTEYRFEVLKSGTILEEVKNLQSKPYWLFGRLPEKNDIVMAHPTISRFHAVLQYRPKPKKETNEKSSGHQKESVFDEGWYIYDLESTHGTFLNKMKIPPKTYCRVKVGYMIKLGGSTRNYILQGPEFDEEPESELSITELRELRARQERDKIIEAEKQEEMREKEGINWGMTEDADEETDLSVNPYAATNNEELFFDDPKKTLRGFFEREGLELEYKVDEMSTGTFICRIELPVGDAHGKPLIAEVCHKGKKKECVVQCALEACRILDRYGVLRQSHHEPLKRKKPKDDSDEDDDFLDRTGDVERKRMRKIAASQSTPLTFDDLVKQENDLLKKIEKVKEDILRYHEMLQRIKKSSEEQEEDLDSYMKNLTDDSNLDKTEIRKLRIEEQRLNSELQKIQRLIKIAEPVSLPSLKNNPTSDSTKNKFCFPLFGKRNKLKLNMTRSETKSKPVEKEMKSDEEENDDEDEVIENPEKNIPETKSPIPTECSADESATKEESNKQPSEIEVEVDANDEELEEKNTEVPRRKIGPTFIPEELLKSAQTKDNSNNEMTTTIDTEVENENTIEGQEPSTKKKRRTRIRTKGRDNIDIDDSTELEDKEKYSEWLPPENQTGDGMTSLNEKFGY